MIPTVILYVNRNSSAFQAGLQGIHPPPPGSCYWNMGFGLNKGEVEQDEEGLRTMQLLGQNMAWLLALFITDGPPLP